MQFKHIACGGTFDLLHKGHASFIKEAFLVSDFVSIGLVSDEFARVLKKEIYQNFDERREALGQLLKTGGLAGRFRIIKLDEIYGPTLTDKTLEGMLVTDDSRKRAQQVNKRRRDLYLAPLKIVTKKMVVGNDGIIISSSRIKAGEIDSSGFNFRNYLVDADFTLPEFLRKNLAKPFGKVLKESQLLMLNDNIAHPIITVGDETTYNFLKLGILPNLSIIDLKVQRKKKFENIFQLGFSTRVRPHVVNNPPGRVTAAMSKLVYDFFISKSLHMVIQVIGEEDLATLPTVLMSPLGTRVYYGLRSVGLIVIEVTPELKDSFLKIIKKFMVSPKNDT